MTPTPEQERGPSRTYSGGAIEVLWEPRLCIHVRNCVRRLPQVFNPEVRPWVVVDAADADRVAATIETCPTGALDDIRARGLRLVPFCPFVRSYIRRHPDYADLVVGDVKVPD